MALATSGCVGALDTATPACSANVPTIVADRVVAVLAAVDVGSGFVEVAECLFEQSSCLVVSLSLLEPVALGAHNFPVQVVALEASQLWRCSHAVSR